MFMIYIVHLETGGEVMRKKTQNQASLQLIKLSMKQSKH